jgi:hypothetical protein
MMEAATIFQTLMNFCYTTRRYNPEDNHPIKAFIIILYQTCTPSCIGGDFIPFYNALYIFMPFSWVHEMAVLVFPTA